MSDEQSTLQDICKDEEYLKKNSRYFKHDNAIFRQRPSKVSRRMSVDDVLHGDVWAPYQGDKVAPVMFGSEIDLSVVLAWMED